MQLTVAENLLGEKALAAEFNTKIPTKTREQRIANAANRVTGWNKFDSSNSIQAQIEAITNGGSDTGEKKIIVNGNQNKFDKLTYDKNEDLTSFSFERNRTIADNQESLQAWTEALPRYQKVSKEFQDKITQLEDQKNSIKDGINFFAKKGNQEKRNVLNREINSLITSLQSSNENINKANLRINSLTAENSKLTQEITNYKVELDREYVL